MSDIFLKVLNGGAAASWAVIAVILARLLLKKAPRRLVCLLWVVVAIRLVLPATLESPVSLIPSAQVINPESMYDHAPVITSGVEFIDNALNPVYTESFRANELASVNPLQVWTAIAANLWFLGMAAMGLWALISYLRLKKRLKSAIPDGSGICVCDGIDTPFILGLLRPVIYLPPELDAENRTHVLAHERAHLARRDHWWKPLAYSLLTVFWFHPMLWVAYVLLCRDIELACDERVIASMGAAEKKGYSTALLQCSIHRRAITACPLAFGEVGVKERVKSVLSYKKPAFWVIVVSIVLCAVVAVCFLTNPVTYTPEIRYNGVLYIREGANQQTIPQNAIPVGKLQTGIVKSHDHPTEDFQAVNLKEEYAGSDLFLYETEVDLEPVQILYAQCPSGGYLPFRLRTPNALIAELSRQPLDIWVSVTTDNTLETEQLQGDRLIAMEMALESLRYAQFCPGSISTEAVYPAAIQFDRRDESANGIELLCQENGQWTLTVQDQDYGPSVWLLPETMLTDDLENQLSRYYNRAEYGNQVFDNSQSDDDLQKVQILYLTFSRDAFKMTLGIPHGDSTWEWEEIQPGVDDEFLACRFRPPGVEKGWINLYYHPDDTVMVHLPAGIQDQITFLSGVKATTMTPLDGDHWSVMQIHTTKGILLAAVEDADGWWPKHGATATSILGSVTLYENGKNLLAEGNFLGIHLGVKDVSPTGLTPVCQQDGTLVEQLSTGAFFSIERYEEGVWTPLETRQSPIFTTEAWGLNRGTSAEWVHHWAWLYGELPPGRYRICKSFSGKLPEPSTLMLPVDWVDQTCYAEFTIE